MQRREKNYIIPEGWLSYYSKDHKIFGLEWKGQSRMTPSLWK